MVHDLVKVEAAPGSEEIIDDFFAIDSHNEAPSLVCQFPGFLVAPGLGIAFETAMIGEILVDFKHP
jgi:hypothetical protein